MGRVMMREYSRRRWWSACWSLWVGLIGLVVVKRSESEVGNPFQHLSLYTLLSPH